MEEDIRVSIVIPVYNVEKYIAQCLDSCINQTMTQGIEIVAVNDGSTDSSQKILEEYQKNYPDMVKVYTIPNGGVSHARNYGVTKAKGTYIIFADSDDFLCPSMCEQLYGKAVADNSDVVLCRYYDVREKQVTGTLIRTKSKVYITRFEDVFDINRYRFELTHISPFPWDKMFKRELVLKYPFPEGIRFEDLSIMYPLILSAGSISVVQSRLYNYRRASEGSFLNTFNENTLDIVKSLSNMLDRIKEDGHYENFKDEIEYICIRHILVRFDIMFNFRSRAALDEKNRGNLELKQKMIELSMDFLEKNFPDWRENRYLKYSSSNKTKRLLAFYESKKKMLAYVAKNEHTPLWLLRMIQKKDARRRKRRAAFDKFMKRKHKMAYILDHIALLKLFRLPRDVAYTKLYEKLPIETDTVLFESKHGDDVAGNMFYMMRSMGRKEYSSFKIYIPLREDLMDSYREIFRRYNMEYVNIIEIDSKQYLKKLASANYLVTDTSFPSYFIKKDGQKYLNTWHGTPLKAMGRVVPQREYALGNVQRNFYMADCLLYQNEFSRDAFIDDYMLRHCYRGKILISGYPRNSAFFNTDRYDAIRDELNISDCQVIAYMPTWRGLVNKKQNKKQISDILNYLYSIDEALDDSTIFYVKLHPFVKSELSYDDFEHIRPFPDNYETYDFLNATDMLVTDYSSIMFDYAVSGKKIALFTYDREEYLKDRGMYLDINEFEFPKADTVDDLIDIINDDSQFPYPEFKKLYLCHDTKDTADNVCDYFFLNKEQKPPFLAEDAKEEGLCNTERSFVSYSDTVSQADNDGETDSSLYSDGVGKNGGDGGDGGNTGGHGGHSAGESNKKNVLIFLNSLKRDSATNRRLKHFNELDTSKYNYYFAFKAKNVQQATRKLAILSKDIDYIPLMYDVNYTVAGRLACFLCFNLHISGRAIDRQLNRLSSIEAKKYFGGINFDAVINYSNKDSLILLMCPKLAPVSVYNAATFKKVLYDERRKYRAYIDFIAGHLDSYTYIAGTDELKDYPSKALKSGKLKSIHTDNIRLEIEDVLKEIEK